MYSVSTTVVVQVVSARRHLGRQTGTHHELPVSTTETFSKTNVETTCLWKGSRFAAQDEYVGTATTVWYEQNLGSFG